MKVLELENTPLGSLRQMARDLNVQNANRLKKEDLILRIQQAEAERDGLELRGGILEIMSEGIGFLRSGHYQPGPYDVYVSQSQIRRYGLRTGDLVIGHVRPPRESERHYGLLKVESVNGIDPEEARHRPVFEGLTPIFPDVRFDLETDRHTLSTRLINLVTPVGRGQRGLIVSPPKAGKTTILKQMANAISTKYPDIHLMVALIGERPEEVTDMDRSVDAEVVSSTFDEPVTSHVRVAEMVLERAKRLVEYKKEARELFEPLGRVRHAFVQGRKVARHQRIDVAVAEHQVTGAQQRHELAFVAICKIRRVNQAERGGREQLLFLALAGGALDELGRIPLAEKDLEPLRLEPAFEQIDLRGLARAVQPFHRDQASRESEFGECLHRCCRAQVKLRVSGIKGFRQPSPSQRDRATGETCRVGGWSWSEPVFGFRDSDFFRVSGFGFRISGGSC